MKADEILVMVVAVALLLYLLIPPLLFHLSFMREP